MEYPSGRWALIALLEAVEVKHTFNKGNWPLHVTLAGAHTADWWSPGLMEEFVALTKKLRPLRVTALEQGKLGAAGNPTRVTYLDKSPQLATLHQQIVGFLLAHGAHFEHPEWTGEGYIPHSTIQKHAAVGARAIVNISSVSLVNLRPASDIRQREIIWTAPLGNT